MQKAAIDPGLPQIWKNSYSAAVDTVEQGLIKGAMDAFNKASSSKVKTDLRRCCKSFNCRS